MADCCDTTTTARTTGSFFSKRSKMYAKRFKGGKLEKEQRLLLDGIREAGLSKQSVLDIGCGVGALHLTLLTEGASHATGVDMAEGMLENAKRFAEMLGVRDRVEYVNGDFVSVAGGVSAADVTMLDKVVCCYENVDELVDISSAKAARLYALTHPAENWVVKLSFQLMIGVRTLFRIAFRPYWHDWPAMRQRIEGRGFSPVYQKSTFWWNVLVYRRTSAA